MGSELGGEVGEEQAQVKPGVDPDRARTLPRRGIVAAVREDPWGGAGDPCARGRVRLETGVQRGQEHERAVTEDVR
ncbi:hypothetical protein QN416_26955, partial [Glaciimonas sp. Cout2]